MVGCLLMGYVVSQNMQNVDSILNNPPGPVAKDIEDLGSDITKMLLRFQASEVNRFLGDVWGVLQLGLGAAFLISAVLTSHRSRFLMIVSSAMILLVVLQMFWISPIMTQLGRSFDFLPLTAALKDRENYQSYRVWYVVFEFLKLLFGLALAIRLLFDRYAWQQKLASPAAVAAIPWEPPASRRLPLRLLPALLLEPPPEPALELKSSNRISSIKPTTAMSMGESGRPTLVIAL